MDKKCVVYRTSDLMGKKWSIPIILEIYKGGKKKRYTEIKNSLPRITPKMLSTRLKELEKHKIIKRKMDPNEIPIRVDYLLTESGKDFIKIIKQMKEWGLKWNISNEECSRTNCEQCIK